MRKKRLPVKAKFKRKNFA